MDLATRLGRPLTRPPETEEMHAACQLLGLAGIDLTERAVTLAAASWHRLGARTRRPRPHWRGLTNRLTHRRQQLAWRACSRTSAWADPTACEASQAA